jgi:hypothetical protein
MASAKANLDVAQKLNITARKGDTFRLKVTFTDSSGIAISVSNYTYRLQVRDDASDDTDSGAIIDLSGDGSVNSNGFEIGSSGDVTIHMSASTMSNINGGKYVYDLEATHTTDNSLVQTWLKGSFVVNEDVTVNV